MSSDISKKRDEIEIRGVSASPGYALGRVRVYRPREFDVSSSMIKKKEVLEHINEFKRARDETEEELEALRTEAGDEQASDILSAQIQMVKDPELANRIEYLIKEELYSVDYAIQKAFDSYLELINNTGNSTVQERSIDITDTRNRLLQIVKEHTDTFSIEKDAVVVSANLSPREVIKLTRFDIGGIVMSCGGSTSHAAIIARSLGVPTIVGAKEVMDIISDGDTVAMNGASGRLVVHPSAETIQKIQEYIERTRRMEEKLLEIVERDSTTADGRHFTLRANIEFAEELDRVHKVRAEGIGLLRSESIYLAKERFEDVRQQEAFYSTVLDGTGEDPVVIRLFDAGGDKIFEGKQQEQNPFLGWRGIRMLLDKRDLLRDQLRAILAAAGRYPGRVRILVPMVSRLEEVSEVRKEMEDIQKILQKEGRAIDARVPLGIMIEVPSVGVQIRHFIDSVDFLSIGTNDLTQYMLAVDRGNELIADIYDQRHPAIWGLIKHISRVSAEENMPVTVCGELASDPVSAACLLGMDIDDLSMSPASLPLVKKVLVSRSHSEMKQLAEQVTECRSPEEVESLFKKWSNE